MRMMLQASIPVESGNAAFKDGSLKQTIQKTMGDLKPEAAYFFTQDGQRGCFMVFDLKDTSEIPSIAEPFFQTLNAKVTFMPVMNAQDLAAGIEKAVAAVG